MIVSGLDRYLRIALFVLVAGAAVSFAARTLPHAPHLDTAGRPAAAIARRAADAGTLILDQLDQARAEAQEAALLRQAAAADGASAAVRAAAVRALDALVQNEARERAVMQALAEQGFGPTLVTLSAGHALVAVSALRLDPDQLDRIGADLWSLAHVTPEDVVVRPGV
jgi:hypothetical protein